MRYFTIEESRHGPRDKWVLVGLVFEKDGRTYECRRSFKNRWRPLPAAVLEEVDVASLSPNPKFLMVRQGSAIVDVPDDTDIRLPLRQLRPG